MARFPGPYLNDTRSEDPIMQRVPMDKSGIGANEAGLPKGNINAEQMKLQHVGGALGKGD